MRGLLILAALLCGTAAFAQSVMPGSRPRTDHTLATTPKGNSFQANLTSPSATNSTTGVMMGFGVSCKIAPVGTRVAVAFMGTTTPNTANIVSLLMKYGTGTAPSAGAAFSGTSIGNTMSAQSATNAANLPVHLSGIVTGLIPQVPYWFDIDILVNTGNGTFVTNSASCNGHEF